MKRFFAAALAIAVSLASVSAQGGKEGSSTNASKGEPAKLKYFMELGGKISATLKSQEEVACFQEMEKRTGIDIEWIHPPVGQAQEQFNLMIASMDLPDMIWWNWASFPGGPAKALRDKLIVPLNEQLDKGAAPELKKLLAANPEAKKQSVLDDGTLYMFPMFRLRVDAPDWFKVYGPQIRKDWLAKTGMKAPTTLDELRGVLVYFKNNDMNGNGDPNDEIPFASQKAEGLRYLSGAFGLSHQFYVKGGRVSYGPVEPAYRDFLATLAAWYKEGLIDREYAVTDGKSMDAKVTGSKVGFYFGLMSGQMGRYLNLAVKNDPNFDLQALPWIIGPAGKPYVTNVDYTRLVPGTGTAITATSKNQAAAARWLDFAYGQEGHLLTAFGVEGQSYTIKDGNPVFTDAVLKSPNGWSIDQALSRYAMQIENYSMVKDSRAFLQVQMVLPQQREAQKYWGAADHSLILPPVSPNATEAARLAAIMTEVNTYVDEMFDKFVMGLEPLSKFDEYTGNLKRMKIDEAIAVNQAALDRYNKR